MILKDSKLIVLKNANEGVNIGRRPSLIRNKRRREGTVWSLIHVVLGGGEAGVYDVARHAVAVRHTDDVGVAKPLRYAPERSCNRVMQQCGNNIQSYILHVLNPTHTHIEVEGKFGSTGDRGQEIVDDGYLGSAPRPSPASRGILRAFASQSACEINYF